MISRDLEALQRIATKYEVDVVKAENLSVSYSCMVFTQAYNEQNHAREFLENISHFSDGVVVLDDGSTDGTGEAFKGDQVVIHLRRQVNSAFNDYSNRSLLMELGVLLNTHWMLFLDLDERIDSSYATAFRWLLKLNGVDLVRFRYVHLWNSKSLFRTDYPHSDNGVQYRLKLIRRKDMMQISENKRLHFELKPYHSNREMRSQILILHLGSLLPEDRNRRYDVYKALDPDNQCQSSYEHLVAPEARTGKLKDLHQTSLKVIYNDLISYLYMMWNSLAQQVGIRKISK